MGETVASVIATRPITIMRRRRRRSERREWKYLPASLTFRLVGSPPTRRSHAITLRDSSSSRVYAGRLKPRLRGPHRKPLPTEAGWLSPVDIYRTLNSVPQCTMRLLRTESILKAKSHGGKGALPLRMLASIAIGQQLTVLAEPRDEDSRRSRTRQSEM